MCEFWKVLPVEKMYPELLDPGKVPLRESGIFPT